MTETASKKGKRDPKQSVTITAQPDETDHEGVARAFFQYPLQASDTIYTYLRRPYSEIGNGALTGALQKQVEAVSQGDMKSVEALLVSQAHTLDAIFHRLAQRAQVQEDSRWFDLFLRLGLRAQAQCARTLETLNTIKNPPVVFARQANVATNQQINVGTQADPPPASQPDARDSTPQLEHTHGNYLDTGTATAASGENQAMAPLGAIDRTADGSRQS